ncbi:MAG: hypothetical protein WBB18_08710 [Nodosilinea sp.]
MLEAGLAIGRAQDLLGGMKQEILSWFDESGHRYPSAEEQAQTALTQVQQTQIQIQAAEAQV